MCTYYIHLYIFIYMHIHATNGSCCNVFVCHCTWYKHVCTMFRHVCTVLPNPVQVGRIPDGHYHFNLSSRPPSSRDVLVSVTVGAGGVSADSDPARISTEGAAPTTPPGGVIDLMRQGSIVGSVGPLHGPGRPQRSHASAGQPDQPVPKAYRK